MADLEAELYVPPLPKPIAYIWPLFLRLSGRRGVPDEMLKWSEIDAFQRVTGSRLDAFDIELIEALDRAYVVEARRPRGD
jgi:hypothetical protein